MAALARSISKTPAQFHSEGRLLARPGPPHIPISPGLYHFEFGERRDGLWFVPKSLKTDTPAPLIVAFHGAGGDGAQMIGLLKSHAEKHGIVLVSPESRSACTWDMIRDSFGPDVAFIDKSLSFVYERVAIDPTKVAAAGFSDGASFALSLGITNGATFTDVLAFSPGFMRPVDQVNHPRIFTSHGNNDRVLAVERCGRKLARVLTETGFDVDYAEFIGGHTVPSEMVERALNRFLSDN